LLTQSVRDIQGGPKKLEKISHCQIIKKIVLNRIEIRFVRQIKEMIKHYNIIRWY